MEQRKDRDYETRETRKRLKQMTFGQKMQYFRDYYLVRTLIIAAAAAAVIYMLARVLGPRREAVLSVAVYDSGISDENREALTGELEDLLGCDGKTTYVSIDDDYNSEYYQTEIRISTATAGGLEDLIIAPRSVFEELAGNGYFRDVSGVLTAEQYEKWEALIVEAAGRSGEESMDLDEESGTGDVRPYGISLAGSERWMEISGMEEPVAGFVLESKREEACVRFLQLMLEE